MKLNQKMKTTMSLAAAMGTLALATSANAALTLITPTSVVASSTSGGNDAINTINSSGLNSPFDETATHDTGSYWQGNSPGVGTTITFNLGSEYDLAGTWIWNYNHSSSTRGMSAFEIYVGGSGDSAASTLVKGDALINLYSQNADAKPAEFEAFAASNVQYVRFVSKATGANDRIGLGEVRFEAVPEPSTTALLGLGGLALILRRRK